MLTVTRDMVLPTTITGSYPRPLWFDRSLAGRSFKTALGDSLFREQYLDAVASIIAEQEAAGLDIVTDGDSRFDLTVGGKSWFFYPIERLGGVCGHRDTSRGWMSRHGLRPGKILCLAKNYAAHAREFGAKPPGEPIFFAKLPDTLVPHGAVVVLPHWVTTRIDHEAELGLVLGFADPERQGAKYVTGAASTVATSLPRYMTAMRSDNSRISSSSGETSSTAVPPSRFSTIRPWMYSIDPTSRPRVGCEATSSRIGRENSLATITFC